MASDLTEASIRELRAAFPDRDPDELAAVLAAHDDRADLAAEALLAEALAGAVEDEGAGDSTADHDSTHAARRFHSAGHDAEQVRADEDYARMLQVRRT